MLKNNEPYRYAQPSTTQQKLARLRVTVTGKVQQPKHKGRPVGVKNGQNLPTRLISSLGQICEREGLPAVHGFEEFPPGEQHVLKSLGVIDYVHSIRKSLTH
jgi:hypothetical protein